MQSQILGIRREAGAFQIVYPPDFPEVVVLIGSSRFKDAFFRVGEELEKSGCLVLSMAFYQHSDGRQVSPEEREVLRKVDRARLTLADRVHVINCKLAWCPHCKRFCGDHLTGSSDPKDDRLFCRREVGREVKMFCQTVCVMKPYVGEDTEFEMGLAKSMNKKITYLNPEEQKS